ncbi:MAG: hypothetical protein AABZ60_03950, partial [Planctomycetota bacterium]
MPYSQKGTISLITLIFVFLLIGLSGVIFYFSNVHSLKIYQQKMELKVFYLADAGLAHGFLALNQMNYSNFSDALIGLDGIPNTSDDGLIHESGM